MLFASDYCNKFVIYRFFYYFQLKTLNFIAINWRLAHCQTFKTPVSLAWTNTVFSNILLWGF